MKKFFLMIFGIAVAASAFAVTPADPTNVKWNDYGDESGYSKLSFSLPQLDTDGNILNTENLGYRVYLDNDQIFTFERSVYTYDNIYGDVTEIWNWQYSGGTDFRPDYIYFYRTNADGYTPFFTWRIGLQVVFVNDNNEVTYSNIVYDEVFPQQTALPKPSNSRIYEWIDSKGGYTYFPAADTTVWHNGSSQIGIEFERDWNGSTWQLLDVDGNYLDPEKVSYSIFTDNDEILVFDEENFEHEAMMGLDMPTTEIPYEYDGWDVNNFEIHFNKFSNITEGQEHFFDWRIGIRTNYREGDEVSYSDISYMEVFPQLQEAKDVTSMSFVADWSCDDPNTYMLNNTINDDEFDVGYNLYIIDVANQDTTVIYKVQPTNWVQDEYGNKEALAGATYQVEGLTPGATYQFYVIVKQNAAAKQSFKSVVREVTLPTSDVTHIMPGDVNHDGKVDVSDVTAMIALVLGNETDACTICANVNGDDKIDVSDVTAAIAMVLAAN